MGTNREKGTTYLLKRVNGGRANWELVIKKKVGLENSGEREHNYRLERGAKLEVKWPD